MKAKSTYLLAILGWLGSCGGGKNTVDYTSPIQPENTIAPTNVILLIGDGMGVPQVSTAYYFGNSEPNFSRFTDIGFHQSSDASHRITDSAAGATAFSIGEKTYKRAVGVTVDTLARPTLLEILKERGYRTGLISLTTITHATPAAFYAHVPDRDLHEEIAEQLSRAGVDFVAGGGRKYFNRRSDGLDLYDRMKSAGYRIDTLALSPAEPGRRNAYFLAEESLPNTTEGRGNFLPDATREALSYFDAQGAPFFLMVEGSYIDWAGHARNDQMLIGEVLDFDRTLGVILDYLEQHPNTLVVVTADHETGEASIGKFYELDSLSGKKREVPERVQISFNSDQHSGELIPVFAKGPGSEAFRGIYQNNEIFHKILGGLR